MHNYTDYEKQSIFRSLREYILKSIRYGLQRRWSKQEIKDFTINNLNVKHIKELEWKKFRQDSKIENIFEAIWNEVFEYDG